jgi:LuxR family transcriptional regulator, maltose regulon positive regulatory protein
MTTTKLKAVPGERSRRTPPWFVPFESKLHVPATRPELVERPHLIDLLRSSSASPLVLVIAPPGYGKTTVLAQWAPQEERPFLWVTLDEADNDASRLLVNIVVALEQALPLGRGIFPRPPEPGPAFTAFALPRLTRALSERADRFVLVLDDVHVLRDRHALGMLATIVENLPPGCQLVLAGRDLPQLRLGRLLVSHSLVTLGTRELAMSAREGTQLLHAAGLPVGEAEAAMLVERTEGWAAGLYLAAIALRDEEHLGYALESFAGSDKLLSDYLKDELLDRLPRDRLEFMLGTAVLERLCGSLCDAVLGTTGSAERLEEQSRANLFLTSTDRRGVWFRRHQLFAEWLLAELRRRDPEREAEEHRRAAGWFEASGDVDTALEHARAAGDHTMAAEMIARHVIEYVGSGRASTVRRWIEAFPERRLVEFPWFGASAAFAYAPNGDLDRATRWLAVAERGDEDGDPVPDGRASLRSAVAITRAALGLGGIGQLERDASLGYELEPEGSPWRALCAFLHGVAVHLDGRSDDAVPILEEAVAISPTEQPNVHAWALAQLALAAMEADDWERGRELADRARMEIERNGLREYSPAALVFAVSALSSAHWRQPAEARRDAAQAARLFGVLSGLAPWMSVEGRIVIAEAHLALGDPGLARESLRAAERDLTRVRDAPVLRRWFDATYGSAMTRAHEVSGPPLTAAEIRVLQFLPTHLSFREIAERLHVSRNTVKTQVMSSYRKLGASSRTEAVERAKALALVNVA